MEVERLQQDYDLDVRFAPFLLDPTIPPEGKTRQPMTRPGDAPSALEQRGEALGIAFARGRTFTPNSHLSLEAAEFAAEKGPSHAFHRAMFKAYFEDMENIGDLETVVRIGASSGLDGDELREALEEGRFREQVDDGIRWSSQIGVTAVPTFVFDEQYGVVGAQDRAVFESVLERLGYAPRDGNGRS